MADVKVGSLVVWNEHGLSAVQRGQRRERTDGPGVVEKIHHWETTPATIRIRFRSPLQPKIAYIDEVDLAEETET